MSQKEIEVILARQLADYLATPIFIVDPQGTLLFYNEPAERILGLRFDETGEISGTQWATMFDPTDHAGKVISPDDLPLMIALNHHRPAFREFWIQGLDGVQRRIQVTAFPLIGQAKRFLGAVAIFWEVVEA